MKLSLATVHFAVLSLAGSNYAAILNIRSSEYRNVNNAADRKLQYNSSVELPIPGIKIQKRTGGKPSYPISKSMKSKSKASSSPTNFVEQCFLYEKIFEPDGCCTQDDYCTKTSDFKNILCPSLLTFDGIESWCNRFRPSKEGKDCPCFPGCRLGCIKYVTQCCITSKTYTFDKDFDEGSLVNINHNDPQKDQLQLNNAGTPLNFIWIALSGRGTIAKVDTLTGTVLGVYNSAPDGRGKNPSRTTVDLNGNVWAGNRDESDGKGSMVHIGLNENAQCVDRNGDGIITTSTGIDDVKPWTNAGGADNNGGVSTAVDECIIHYTRTAGTGLRTIAVDANNNVWTGGLWNGEHEKINGSTGVAVPGTQFNKGCGGYGGLVDKNGILWSAGGSPYLLRIDTKNLGNFQCINFGTLVYGLGRDTNGFIWNTDLGTAVRKIAPDGSLVTTFQTVVFGASGGSRGVAVTPADNNVWVANSNGNTVSRLDNNGNIVASITVGVDPTGVAVDAAGKVWVTNLGSDNAMRINPATNLVDLTVFLGVGSAPYDYSDMTGSTLSAPPKSGTWTVTYDSGVVGMHWSNTRLVWNAYTPSDSSVNVEAQSSADNGVTWSGFLPVTKGGNLSGIPPGKLLQIRVLFNRASTGAGPVLYDLSIATLG